MVAHYWGAVSVCLLGVGVDKPIIKQCEFKLITTTDKKNFHYINYRASCLIAPNSLS